MGAHAQSPTQLALRAAERAIAAQRGVVFWRFPKVTFGCDMLVAGGSPTASPDELSAAERIRSARRRANEQRNATESEAPAETTTEAVDREDERRSVSTITENQLPPPPLDGPTEVSRSVQTHSPTPGRS